MDGTKKGYLTGVYKGVRDIECGERGANRQGKMR